MLTRLHHKALIGYFALFALMLNAMTQVDCCVSSIAGEHGGPIAAAMDTVTGEGGHQHHGAHASQMAMDAGHGPTTHADKQPASGHSGHDAGSCDCKDGMCGQSLIALAQSDEAGFDRADIGEAWSVSAGQQRGHTGAKQFQIRAPPVLL